MSTVSVFAAYLRTLLLKFCSDPVKALEEMVASAALWSMNARTSLSPLGTKIYFYRKHNEKSGYAQFKGTWFDQFAPSGGDGALQKLLVSLLVLEYLDIARANPIWVASSKEILVGVLRQPAFKESRQEMLEVERKAQMPDI